MKIKSYKNPWEEYPEIWKTQSAFFTWLRGCIRRSIWDKYPPKHIFKNSKCVSPPKDYKGRAKSGANCSLSGDWTAKSYLEVDHIEGNASLKGWDDLLPFIQHLCTNTSNMQLVSKEAHKIKSYSEKEGISFEEALITKKAINLIREKKDKQFFIDRKLSPPSNVQMRRKHIINILTKEHENATT